MIQIDGPGRRVFIKLNTSEQTQTILQTTNGKIERRHDNVELSIVELELARMGIRRIRIANLPPKVPDRIIRETLSTYGDVTEISEETWSNAYRYPVPNGIRIAVTRLKNISHLTWQCLATGFSYLTKVSPLHAMDVMTSATNTTNAQDVDK